MLLNQCVEKRKNNTTRGDALLILPSCRRCQQSPNHTRNLRNDICIMAAASKVRRPCNKAGIPTFEPRVEQAGVHVCLWGNLRILRVG